MYITTHTVNIATTVSLETVPVMVSRKGKGKHLASNSPSQSRHKKQTLSTFVNRFLDIKAEDNDDNDVHPDVDGGNTCNSSYTDSGIRFLGGLHWQHLGKCVSMEYVQCTSHFPGTLVCALPILMSSSEKFLYPITCAYRAGL